MSNLLIEAVVLFAAFILSVAIMFAVMWMSTKDIPSPEKRKPHAKKSRSGKD